MHSMHCAASGGPNNFSDSSQNIPKANEITIARHIRIGITQIPMRTSGSGLGRFLFTARRDSLREGDAKHQHTKESSAMRIPTIKMNATIDLAPTDSLALKSSKYIMLVPTSIIIDQICA